MCSSTWLRLQGEPGCQTGCHQSGSANRTCNSCCSATVVAVHYSSARIHLPTLKRSVDYAKIKKKTRLSQNGETLRRENKQHILVLMPFVSFSFWFVFMQTQFSHWSPSSSFFKGSAPTVDLRRTARALPAQRVLIARPRLVLTAIGRPSRTLLIRQ